MFSKAECRAGAAGVSVLPLASACHSWPLTAETRFQSCISPHTICGGQSGTDTGFFQTTSDSLSVSYHQCSILIPSSTSLIHLAVCLTTGPKHLLKTALHTVRSRDSSFKWEYLLLSLRSSSSFLRLLPRLPVTSIPLFIFPSITRCRRQFLRKMWPIQFVFRLRISCRIFLCSSTLSNTYSLLTWSVQMIFFILLQHHISKLSRCFWSTARSVQVSAPYKAMLQM